MILYLYPSTLSLGLRYLFEPHLFLFPQAFLNLRKRFSCVLMFRLGSFYLFLFYLHLRLSLPPYCHHLCLVTAPQGGYSSFLFKITDSVFSLVWFVVLYIYSHIFPPKHCVHIVIYVPFACHFRIKYLRSPYPLSSSCSPKFSLCQE